MSLFCYKLKYHPHENIDGVSNCFQTLTNLKCRNFSDIAFYDSLTFTTGTSPSCPDPTHKPNATECGTAEDSLVCYNGVSIAFLFFFNP